MRHLANCHNKMKLTVLQLNFLIRNSTFYFTIMSSTNFKDNLISRYTQLICLL